jgi:hypothetical protein
MEDLHNALNKYVKQLALLENENIALKTQLAHILQYNFDRTLLETIEYYHTIFLQHDTRFEALRSEIALQQMWLGQSFTDAVNRDNIYRHQLHMQEKLDKIDRDLQKHKTAFHIHFPERVISN